MGRYMGKKIHRQGLITRVELDGITVFAEISPDEDEEFALSILEKYLQINYPGTNIAIEYVKWGRFTDRVKLTFVSAEEAMHFYLSH